MEKRKKLKEEREALAKNVQTCQDPLQREKEKNNAKVLERN